jgi:nicotinate-nucleotide adenylyltransferase
MKPELAVFGGSFDPPHVAHVFLATYARSVAGVERVLVAPTFRHAFDKPLSDFDHRLRMCELAFAPLHGVEVSPIERELGGVSRTLRLVSELTRRFPRHQLRLLVGADILLQSQRWDRFDEITAIAPLLVVGRGGYHAASRHHLAAATPVLPELSSSAIRGALSEPSNVAARSEVTAWLPRDVHAYITEHALYAAAER